MPSLLKSYPELKCPTKQAVKEECKVISKKKCRQLTKQQKNCKMYKKQMKKGKSQSLLNIFEKETGYHIDPADYKWKKYQSLSSFFEK